MTQLQSALSARFPGLRMAFEEPLAKHTSFRIGGPAEVMAFPGNTEELSRLLKESHLWGIVPVIIGAGTNLLAPDEGLRGLVICTKDALEGMEQTGPDRIRVAAGVTMSRAAVYAANLGLSGLEFAHGIPGTVGGGVKMNAGAYGGEICQVARQTAYLTPAGERGVLAGEQQGFSYRHSTFSDQSWVITETELQLTPGDPQEIRGKMQELMAKRRASQPLDRPSAGSTFKRPVGGYAAALIDQAGLKGFAIGGAMVSEKHAGFVVNRGGATAVDVKALMAEIQRRVFDHSGIRLEPEVIFL